jgi:hypothetical protein
MDEPTLESIEDYDTLKGSKKKVVWGVIIAGLVIAVVYLGLFYSFGKVDDSIKVESSLQKIPLK